MSSTVRKTPIGLARWAPIALLSAALLLVHPTAAAAAPGTSTTQTAAGWLAGQLVNGDHIETDFNGQKFPDYGMTADAILAFAAAGVADDAAAKATDFLAKPDSLTGYLGDGTTESYAGAHAKLLLTADVRETDATAFGGVNLPERLLALQAENGRFSDKSAFGDYSNTFSQALAIIALQRIEAVPQPAVDFLRGTACPDGGFGVVFGQTPCVSDADATAMAAQALLAVDADASTALDWLESAQLADGSFSASPPADQPNSNSTGLAAAALRIGNRDAAADKAVGFLTAQQVGCDGPVEQQGGIALLAGGFDPKTAPRATAQAVLGFAGVSLARLSAADSTADIPHLDCDNAPPTTDPTPTGTNPTPPQATVAPPNRPNAKATLANTGAPTASLFWMAAGLLAGGSALVLIGRQQWRKGSAEQ